MSSKLNCEVLDEDLAFEVRWAVAGDSVVIQLVAKLEHREYMSFGVSGNELKSEMIGGDVAVVWVDKNSLKGYADDYYLDDKSQCSGPQGSCPDERLGERSNSIRLLNAAMVNGYSIVTYQRLQRAADEFDRPIFTNKSQAIIWAVGPLNQRDEVSFHTKYTKGDRFVDFGRPATWNCPSPEDDSVAARTTSTTTEEISVAQTEETTTQRPRAQQRRRGGANRQQPAAQDSVAKNSDKAVSRTRTRIRTTEAPTTTEEAATTRSIPTPAPASTKNAWEIPPIQCYEPEDGVFYAQMGPTGGKSGYPAITGHVGWGISWYINGLLIPEINVVRGKTYTFVVEGGLDSEIPAKFHPFYITDDPVGGYEYKTPEERERARVFAGVKFEEDGTAIPTGTGRLCHWTHQGDLEADDFESFGAYQRTLELKCDQGEPGIIQWTPDQRTPDTVYYQCFTHRYLGWKINVHDSCDVQPEASELDPTIVLPPEPAEAPADLEDSASAVVETKVAPPPNDIEIPEDLSIQSDRSEDEVEDLKNSLALAQTLTVIKPPRYSAGPPKGYYPPPSFYSYKPVFPGYRPDVFRPSPIIFDTAAKMGPKPKRNKTTLEQVTTTTAPTTTASSNTTDSIAEEIKVQTQSAAVHPQASNPTAYVLPLTRLPPTPPEIRYRKPSPMFLTKSHMKYPGVIMFRKPMPISLSLVKGPGSGPFPMKYHDKPILLSQMQSQLRPQAVIILKRPPAQVKKPSLAFVDAAKKQPKGKPQMHVEISPPQASTEKEPSIITEKPFSYPSSSESLKEIYTIRPVRPAFNTGFRPDSIIVEGGFKPIVSKEVLERSDKGGGGPELEYESEIGVIDVRADPLATESFEPMFIPSPTEKQRLAPQKQAEAAAPKVSHKSKKNSSPFTVIIKHGRQQNFQDREEVVETAANERVDTYYLPPANQPPRISHANVQPSNIDFNPGILVSYDGKRISGVTLTAQVNENGTPIDLTSKAGKLLRTTPQFGMYKGNLPPLDRQSININIPQLNSQGILNRDLEGPPTDNSRVTRLRLIRGDDGRVQRRKREAHHTPEHTAQQERERREETKNASRKLGFTNVSMLVLSVLMMMMMM